MVRCNAIQTTGINEFSYTEVDIGSPDFDNYEVMVKVCYSSICGTDRAIVDGSLLYYQNGKAKYPIITGHEWCGLYKDKPVTGVCILPCKDNCCLCRTDRSIHCLHRKEVGVVNKNGAHSEYVIMPEWCLVPIPEVSPKYVLTEPLAVVLHGLDRIKDLLKKKIKIIIYGYGSIGKLCSSVLNARGIPHHIYDPEYSVSVADHYDLLIECSGAPGALDGIDKIAGGIILGFGFEYKIMLGTLVAHEINFISTLGSTRDDFVHAVKMMKHIEVDTSLRMSLRDFDVALNSQKKVILDHLV